MPRRIPVRAAKQIAQEFDCRQVILLAWDGKLTHVVTYGKSMEDCDQAAQGGNKLKKHLGWPDSLHDFPPRVKRMQAELKSLRARVKELERTTS